jgi:hypothetical protein
MRVVDDQSEFETFLCSLSAQKAIGTRSKIARRNVAELLEQKSASSLDSAAESMQNIPKFFRGRFLCQIIILGCRCLALSRRLALPLLLITLTMHPGQNRLRLRQSITISINASVPRSPIPAADLSFT